ncbi:MAG: indole-3-glycerol phosphate synthase TrpC [Thermoanaerobaculia bacterium]
MNTVLSRIVTETRAGLDPAPDLARLSREAELVVGERDSFRFHNALSRGREASAARLIAEIKAASPSAGTIVHDPDVAAIATGYREGGAAAISIVTEPKFFRGSRTWIAVAAEASGRPVVMKDFIVEPQQIDLGVAAGADALLLIVAILTPLRLRELLARIAGYGCDALVEVHDETELDVALECGAKIIGVNNRDLRDFSVDLETSERLVRGIPEDVVRVSESGIRTRADVDRLLNAGFDAFLVGESLLRNDDRVAAVRGLVNRGAGEE